MKLMGAISFSRMSFSQQIALTFSVGVLFLTLSTSFILSSISNRTIYNKMTSQGVIVAKSLARQSELSLLYRSEDIAREAALATMGFPDVVGVAVYTPDRQRLFEAGMMASADELVGGDERNAQQSFHLENEDYWIFSAPVYSGLSQKGEDEPFSGDSPVPEFIGSVDILMSKLTLTKIGQDILKTNLIVSAISSAVLLLLLLMISSRASRPLQKLVGLMGRAQKGEGDVRADFGGPRDIVCMESSFNSMMEELEFREKQLKVARDSALAFAHAKGEFAAAVSHELRTPMNGVMGMLELLEDTGLNNKQEEYLGIAKSSSRSLLLLIDDVLDFSKMESAKMKLHPSDFSLREVLVDVIELLRNQANAKGLALDFNVDESLPELITGDSGRIRQILINLVGNAIKFTTLGHVSVHVGVDGCREQELLLKCSVCDTGIGVAVVAQKKIFDAFSQIDGSTTRKFGGTGLGLAICRQLVDLMGGNIGVVSRPDEGSTFWFSVPVGVVKQTLFSHAGENGDVGGLPMAVNAIVGARQQATSPALSANVEFIGDRKLANENLILIVDDNSANRYVAQAMLERLGYPVQSAANGIEALGLLSEKRISLILMDCHMPVLDGYGATKEIREQECGDQHVPIVAMSASVSAQDKERCLASGMDAFLEKPLQLKRLREQLNDLLDCPVVLSNSLIVDIDKCIECPVKEFDDIECNIINHKALRNMKNNTRRAFPLLLETFLEDMPQNIQQLERSTEQRDKEKIHIMAHGIKGSALNLGGNEVVCSCLKIESYSKRADYGAIKVELLQLRSAYGRLSSRLRQEIQKEGQLIQVSSGRQRVLVVDDDRGARLILRVALEQEQFQVEEAEDGVQALECCQNHMPDLILMDVMMPRMDGFEATKKIQQMDCDVMPPILMVTALDDEVSIEKAFSAGATDYISKPVNLAAMRNRIVRLLRTAAAEKHIDDLSYKDQLTGLPNRAFFIKKSQEVIEYSKQESKQFAVLFIDLDRFKLINEIEGHDIGDQLLKVVARRMKCCVRTTDMVARLGGDEFIVLLDDISSLEVVARVANKICQTMADPFVFMQQKIRVPVSIGAAIFPQDGGDVSTLLKHADTAMFRAKACGGGGHQFYEYGMEAELTRRVELERELRLALERDELVLHYQPQVDLKTGALVGVEALVRWQHPQRGFLPPSEFISIAEESGLIIFLGDWVMREGCRQYKTWLDAGIGMQFMAINVSNHQLKDASFVERLKGILAETNMPPKNLKLEMTESVIAEGAADSVALLQELKGLHISLAIDDFGTGYSSLSYLKQFPVDTLKLDRSFISGLPQDKDSAALVSGIIALAHRLRLEVVGEGIETQEQKTFLMDEDCDVMQGYLLSRPLPACEFEEWLVTQYQNN